MKKTSKLFITIGVIGVVALACAAGFLLKSSQGRITTSEPIQVLSENLTVNANVQGLNPVVIKNSLLINGKKNLLLLTFQDPEKAMKAVKKRNTEFLQLMKKKWSLDDLNASSWKTYKQHLVPYTAGKMPDDLGGDKYEKQRQEFEGFLGIYEDDEINQKTIKHINFANFLLNTRLIKQVSLDPIVGKLPFDAPLVKISSPS